MWSHPSVLAALPQTTTEPAATTTTVVDTAGDGASSSGVLSSVADVITTVVDNLGANGYHTGTALVVATIAIVAMLNLGVHKAVLVPVAVGTFWAGWLGWNTLTGHDHALFPGDVEATKLWDVALAGDNGFLIVVIVACVAAIFIWRRSLHLAGRLWLLFGAVLGASFVYNLVEAFRTV